MKRHGIILATAATLALLAGCAPYYYDRDYGYYGDSYYGGGYGNDGGSYGYRDRYGRRNGPSYGYGRYRDGRGYRGPYRSY